MRYAVNVYDLTMLDSMPVSLLVVPHIQEPRELIKSGEDIDDGAVVLQCPEKQAAAICVLCATLLSEKSKAAYPCRVYRESSRAETGWKQLTRKDLKKLDEELKEAG